ncbi:MAG: amylo-alpha-1,6-glucosidase [Candidatus Eisenbacteria bacterium]
MDEKLQENCRFELAAGDRDDGARKLPVVGKRRGLQIVVGRHESREYILTNKEKAYFAGETGTTNTRSYEGLIVELHKFLEGWDLLLGDRPLSSWGVKSACVLPQSMTREHIVEQTTETVFLADELNLLILTYSTSYRGRAAFLPRVDIRSIWEERRPEYDVRWDEKRRVLALRRSDHPARTPGENHPVWVAVACDRATKFSPEPGYRQTTYTKDAARRAMGSAVPYAPGRLEFRFEGDDQFAAGATFSVAVGDELEDTIVLAVRGIKEEFALYDLKMRRVSDTMEGVCAAMRDRDYRHSLSWAAASVDGLIMNQLGRGIFAGLHWFPNYWGRDTFICLPGACLVRGEFDTAREILETFAAMQETEPGSPFLGRIPNLAMPGETYYNTADGTWWFVREACEYVRYTGDEEFAGSILGSVERAIEGAFATRVDDDTLLRHGQAETWMDAGGEAGPHSPRGDRAVEVQALWYTALRSGAELARLAARSDLADRWTAAADDVRVSFGALFWDEHRARLHDHVDPDGTPDRQLRPNQIFAVTVPWDDLLSDERQEEVVRLVSETCVLPHGVASLAPSDPNFHPRHLDLERYHFDEAYHNGDVWVWLTGPVVSAYLRMGMVEEAWEQTRVLTDLMYDEGAAGTLPELRNGVPPAGGENVAGAVSQAWSLAEYVRNFYQDYVGLKPDVPRGELGFRPALPRDLAWVKTRVRVGDGVVSVFCDVAEDSERGRFTVSSDGSAPPLLVRFEAPVPLRESVRRESVSADAMLEPGGRLVFEVSEGADGWSARLAPSPPGGSDEP